MASIMSLEESKFDYFKMCLEDGNLEGMKENINIGFVDKTIDYRKSIHIACENNDIDIVRYLIDENCNIECEDKNYWRPIHIACKYGNVDIIKLLISSKCNIECKGYQDWRPIHFACGNGNIDIVKLLIVNKCNIESEDDEKKRPIHFACWAGNIETVKLLMQQNCDIESEALNKYRPIHFACQYHFVDIAKLLIANNCDITCMDEKGLTPLDLAKKEGLPVIVNVIKEVTKAIKDINNSILKDDVKNFDKLYKPDILTGLNWLETVFERKAKKVIDYFLKRPIDSSEIHYMKNLMIIGSKSTNAQLWQEIFLFKCIRDHHEEAFQLVCCANIVNGQRRIITSSFLELVAEHGNCVFVDEILKKSIFEKEKWEAAKKIAIEKGYHQIKKSISNREALLEYRERANLSILHTAVCDNDPDMVEYILNSGLVDPNQNHEILGTALTLAISMCYVNCIAVLDRVDVNCNTQNKYLQSPLQEAISNGMIENCRFLIDREQNINRPGFLGQTALHCAVIKGCENLCNQLVRRGADCSRYLEFLQYFPIKSDNQKSKDTSILKRENALTLCAKLNGTIYPCFLRSLDSNKANSSDYDGNSLLQLTVKLLNTKLCNILISAGGDIDSLNNQGNTALFELLYSLDEQTFKDNKEKIIEIVNIFTQSGCDLNKTLKCDLTLFKIVSKFNCERLLLSLLRSDKKQSLEIDEDLFKIALNKQFYQFCEILLDTFPKKQLELSITTNIIEIALQQNCIHLFEKLILNANCDVQQIMLDFSLYNLAQMDMRDSFENLLTIELKYPLCAENGESLLTTLIKERKFHFCQLIIDSNANKKKYINLKNRKNQTPLQVAVEIEAFGIAQNLIFETENMNNVDYQGRTALMQLFNKISTNVDKNQYLECLNVIKTIIIQGGDIYHKTPNGNTIIQCCLRSQTKTDIENFFKDKQKRVKIVKETVVERKICEICMDREIDSVFECGHTICLTCADKLVRCPFCSFEPVRAKRIFLN